MKTLTLFFILVSSFSFGQKTVYDFGVKGDGSDEATVFQNAVYKLKGQSINIPNGIYRVGNLSIPAHTKLVGGSNVTLVVNSITVLNSDSSSLENLNISGVGVWGTLLIVLNSPYVSIKNCSIINHLGEGIALRNSPNCTINNNSIYNTDVCIITYGDCGGTEIRSNYLKGGTSDGIAIFGQSYRNGNLIYNTDILPTDSVVIDREVLIADNKIKDKIYGNGVILRCAESIIVSDNKTDNCLFGIGAMQRVKFVQVNRNTLRRSLDRGIGGMFNYSTVSENLVDSSNMYGIWIGSENSTDLIYNTIITNNMVRNTQQGIMLTSMAGGIVDKNNVFDTRKISATYGGINVLYGKENIITSNTIQSAIFPILIQKSKDNIVKQNKGNLIDQGTGTKKENNIK